LIPEHHHYLHVPQETCALNLNFYEFLFFITNCFVAKLFEAWSYKIVQTAVCATRNILYQVTFYDSTFLITSHSVSELRMT